LSGGFYSWPDNRIIGFVIVLITICLLEEGKVLQATGCVFVILVSPVDSSIQLSEQVHLTDGGRWWDSFYSIFPGKIFEGGVSLTCLFLLCHLTTACLKISL
jgi:hypothetical protein